MGCKLSGYAMNGGDRDAVIAESSCRFEQRDNQDAERSADHALPASRRIKADGKTEESGRAIRLKSVLRDG
ncbi:hypothetical protein [Methylobacterium sp. GXF4]|uniref:hypothetical protein n=1 Tax=Methylobacterium sp. GXF4 TaxID=1096546 RepID=UPI000FFE6D19|nr:hypothetical protein [Methylobacterium sp. GXF4]